MSTQMERMKQLIEAKKNKNNQNNQVKRPEGGSVTTRKGFNNKKTGGAFDK
ncbi:MAG: hypothetical protein RR448_00020 [Niameybacter sp.]|uniref:hypothetical protein n=1 Tax=Niameybacter sp. TaxID=2033640 RepID=UPI002FC9C35A